MINNNTDISTCIIFILETMKEACVEVDCISASWSQDRENLILNDISFKVDNVRYCILASTVSL